MTALSPPDIDALRTLLSYDPETGVLTWRWRDDCPPNVAARLSGAAAGTTDSKGYMVVPIRGRRMLAHRVAWALHYGEWPAGHLDHIDGDRANNRISNLRPASVSENARNRRKPKTNKSGRIGVRALGNRWHAQIFHSGKNRHLGFFATFEEACRARAQAETEIGYHPNHGRPE